MRIILYREAKKSSAITTDSEYAKLMSGHLKARYLTHLFHKLFQGSLVRHQYILANIHDPAAFLAHEVIVMLYVRTTIQKLVSVPVTHIDLSNQPDLLQQINRPVYSAYGYSLATLAQSAMNIFGSGVIMTVPKNAQNLLALAGESVSCFMQRQCRT
jgi:hypothetical protein